MIDNSEQQKLTDMNLCNSCRSYRCAFLIDKKREYGSDPFVKKCDGYKS